MSKQYGLILPGQQKKAPAPATREVKRPSIFDEESSDDDNAPPQLKPRNVSTIGPGAMDRRIARKVQEKALEEDPTVFQYDELYDEMENKREEQKQTKAMEPKKPKYIARLLQTAERRKLEHELRIERQVQKEREAEGEEFKDKEAFVTSAYRKKLEEIRQMEEKDKREEYLEAIGDVTKQKDLDGFYRHLYEQKLGAAKNKPSTTEVTTAADTDEISYKPIKSGKPITQRAYRKRHSSDEDDEEKIPADESKEIKKVHLPNNIDADSDFSIDDSSSSDDESKNDCSAKKNEKLTKENEKSSQHTKAKDEVIQKSETTETNTNLSAKPLDEHEKEKAEVFEKPNVVKPKIDIWKKRTVGEVFDAAVQRYYERKAARNA